MRRRTSVTFVVAVVFAVVAAVLQAAPAYAVATHITEPDAPGTPAAVLNAYACGNPANIVQWPYSAGASCASGGSNEVWNITPIDGDGNTSIIAYYGGNAMCMNVWHNDYAQGTPIVAYPCNNGVTDNEEFSVHTNYDLGGYDIAPEWQPHSFSLCFNVWGGFGQGNQIKLYPCDTTYTNEVFATG